MNILLGVSGGIAVYKMLNVLRLLFKAGHNVKVIMTINATKFVSPFLFGTLSGNKTYVDDFQPETPIAHIELADWADVFVLAPATANTIAKIANGIADNLLTSTVLALNCRRLFFPAMNVHMYENPMTRHNIKKLEKTGWELYAPEEGALACGYEAKGRLPKEEFIFRVIHKDPTAPLKNKHFVVTAGATVEKLDPVRFISNFSSGKMGVAIAERLYYYGAEVDLICGTCSIEPPPHIKLIKVESTEEMLTAIRHHLKDADGLFMAAAPADFRAAEIANHKIKKKNKLVLELSKTVDILKTIGKEFPLHYKLGFALESENAEENSRKKLKEKGLDAIVLNIVSEDFNPMGSDENNVLFIPRNGKSKQSPRAPKSDIADWILKNALSEFTPQ